MKLRNFFALLQTLFEPKLTIFEISKVNMVKNPERVMALYVCVRYFDFKGSKSWKNYAWNILMTMDRDLRPNCASDQKVEENRPPPKASNCNLTARDYFMCMKKYFWENYKILITLAIQVLFKSLGIYGNIWARGFQILDYHTLSPILSHTFIHSFRQFEPLFKSHLHPLV